MEMYRGNLTIEEYLRLPNPVISNHDGEKFSNEISGGTTRNPKWVSPRSIHRWREFNYQLFEELFHVEYGKHLREILGIKYNFADLSDLKYPFCEVRDEDSLEALIISSVQRTVCEALRVAQWNLLAQEDCGMSQSDPEPQIGQESIYMARGGQAVIGELDFDDSLSFKNSEDKNSPPNKEVEHEKTAPPEVNRPKDLQPKDRSSKMKSKHKSWRPDWAGVKRPDWAGVKAPMSMKKPRNLLPGDTKVSTVFKSSQILRGSTRSQDHTIGSSKKSSWFYALSQIFTYCTKANARYGYLITDRELVVIKIRPMCRHVPPPAPEYRRSSRNNTPQPISDEGELRYKAIPWTHDKSDELTINLALWALHLMAAKDGGLTKDDHTRQSPYSNESDLQDSSPDRQSINLLHTPRSDPSGAAREENEANVMSQTSQTRRLLLEIEIGDNVNESSPTGKKRKRDSKEEPKSRKVTRGRRGPG
ncbi:eukaryotic translation initiation factor 3 subunit L [Physcia stellaris]|nr:eukaryotic translation initiation factor 3 subunit L [Physcia stellaris]